MRARLLLPGAALVALGCARIVVTAGPQPPASNRDVVDVHFSHSFLFGLVPSPEVTVREACPRGAARVQTRHSPGNVVATLLTLGLYTPMEVMVVCAPPPDGPERPGTRGR